VTNGNHGRRWIADDNEFWQAVALARSPEVTEDDRLHIAWLMAGFTKAQWDKFREESVEPYRESEGTEAAQEPDVLH